jgi:hypothetical protein
MAAREKIVDAHNTAASGREIAVRNVGLFTIVS